MKKVIFTIIGSLIAFSLSAKIWMPSVFSDNMVLQQQSDVAFWGTSKSGAKISISTSWSKAKVSITADDTGKWFARVKTPSAGGPHSITVSDGEKVTFSNVLIGEVWFCSGQSNMEMPVKGFNGQPVEGATDVILSAKPSTPIRMCTVKKCTSATPKTDCKAIWLENYPDAVANTSATAYFFARYLQMALDVPIGILIANWGGTLIEPWISRDVMSEKFPEYDLSFLDGEKLPEKSQYKPCTLFNGMVNPLIPYTIKGWIWYQGESNRGMEDMYVKLQPAYAQMMRDLWGEPDMPFYFVQIAPYSFKGDALDQTAARLMEAQAKTLDLIPHSGMATTADIGEEWCIHPAKKKEVGRRLALMALKNDYGKPVWGAFAPMFSRAEYREDGKVLLFFKNNDSGLGPVNEDIPGFEVAGEDRVFYPATGRVQKGYATILVSCPDVEKPVAVRYVFHNYAPGLVHNGNGIAMPPFRTDDWE